MRGVITIGSIMIGYIMRALPNDVVRLIDNILHRDNMNKLNAEYHKPLSIYENNDLISINGHEFNWMRLNEVFYAKYAIIWRMSILTYHRLPKRYFQ